MYTFSSGRGILLLTGGIRSFSPDPFLLIFFADSAAATAIKYMTLPREDSKDPT